MAKGLLTNREWDLLMSTYDEDFGSSEWNNKVAKLKEESNNDHVSVNHNHLSGESCLVLHEEL